MIHNEDSRVKIPAILHLMKLGYGYLSLKDPGVSWDKSTNIFTKIFFEKIRKLNPEMNEVELQQCYDDIALSLENEDLGKAFYEKLIQRSGTRLLDLENFENNSFHVVTELTYKKDDEDFRPDITLLINGMPLIFIEVKKPNNRDGILSEHKRMKTRFSNSKFRKFANITQLMVFSNNMKYDDNSPLTLEGAFYSSTSYSEHKFNYFREEEQFPLSEVLTDLPSNDEDFVLQDNNLVSIKNSREFAKNKNPESPTNSICTSLFQKRRLAFLLEFGLVYVKETKGLKKHVMRYPQLFATKAIEKTLDAGLKKGIIWHTQGSGKTALSYFNVRYLTHYFKERNIVSKFYFVVDRLDLLTQASREFKARGLKVHSINSREEFSKDIKKPVAIHNDSGDPEVTVVNIQRFVDESDVIKNNDYSLNIQRVFFLDEVHRSYNPKGSFLANLEQADRNAIKIGLTGTPLLGDDYNSRALFGDYIHKYYYNESIKDGYTLKLIREEIETQFKLTLQKTLEEIQILKGHAKREDLYSHEKFVEPMLDYIVKDLEQARFRESVKTFGGMVICDSSKQARKMYEIFQHNYGKKDVVEEQHAEFLAAEPEASYTVSKKLDSEVKTAALILHDSATKSEIKDHVEDFIDGKIDLLIVFKMLQTGFDAPRLKKLYIGRIITAHNLLQALTRVNRTYENLEYGYVVDFADIQSEFEKTNKAYLEELESELGKDSEHYSNLFKSEEEIEKDIANIKEVLFAYDTTNLEEFGDQINEISTRADMLKLTNALKLAKELYNIIRRAGDEELLQKLDIGALNQLSNKANERLSFINQKEILENKVDTTNLLNIALEDVIFAFTKVGQEEMLLADELKTTLQKTREGLGGNFDPKDPEFVSLKSEMERLFKKGNLKEVSREEMESNIKTLNDIHKRAKELERRNQLLKAKYDNDEKYVRLHKRLMEKNPLTDSESKLFEALKGLKAVADAQIQQNSRMIENEAFVNKMMQTLVYKELKTKRHFAITMEETKRINSMVVKEYMNEYYGIAA